MQRDEFLQKHWRAYPSASPDWRDVATFERKGGAWVAGRVAHLDGDRVALEAGGARFETRWAAACRWRDEAAAFASSLLKIGDTVALEIQAHEARTCVLLTPAQDAYVRAPFDVARSRAWAKFLRTVREFFEARDFVEAWTPTLVPSPGTEPYLLPFATEWEWGLRRQTYYLPTSPEFHLKKMLVAGWTRIFEIKTCFRNGEIGVHHQPEFQMLEWYRAYANLDQIADDTADLIAAASGALGSAAPRLERTTIAKLFAQKLSFELYPNTTRAELLALARAQGIETRADDTWDEVYFRLFLERIEPDLGANGPLLVRGYPPSQAALSRIGADGFADRFEVYWRGLELANAFHELNDPAQNEARFAADASEKQRLGVQAVPKDEELLRALRAGLPPSGGIALGLERLFMAIMQVNEIAQVRAFPIEAD